MSNDKLQSAVARSDRAAGLLRDDLLTETFAKLEKDYIEAWRQSPARDTDGRERLWQAVNIVEKVRDHLFKILNDGKLAKRQLDEFATPKPR